MIKRNRSLYRILLISLVCQVAITGFAQEKPAKTNKWNGSAELGFLSTKGNTDTESLNLKVSVTYTTPSWDHKLKLETLETKDREIKTADRFEANYRTRYKLSDIDYVFGSLRYEDDVFAGFDQRTTEIIGYSRDYIKSDTFKLTAEYGVGAKQTDFTDGTETDEGVIRLAVDMEYKISDTSNLKQLLSIEEGEENTLKESVTELKVRINAALALKSTIKVKDNSVVPVGKKNTDTETAVTLVYDF